MTIRIRDIAAKAGVSPTTVSNVIHGNNKKVSKETISKIEKLLNENHYIPSMGAHILAGNHSHLIGVLIGKKSEATHSIAEDPFTSVLLRTLEIEIFKHGYYMLFHMSDNPQDNWKLAATWDAEGLITIGLNAEENTEIRKLCNIPVVSIDVYYPESNVANIGLKDEEGGYMMASWLIDKGHQNFLFLSEYQIGSDYMRWQGVTRALQENHLTVSDSRHVIIPSTRNDRIRLYEKELSHFLACGALFFASDYYAAEAVNYFHSQGIEIPEELSVSGFDDNIYASMCFPKLTTIRQDIPAKGIAAVNKLFTLLSGEQGIQLEERLPVSLIIRDSVR